MQDASSVGPRTNIVLSLGILALCGLGWLAADSLPPGLRVDPLGPAYYPRFVLLSLAALAVALLVASLRDLRRERDGLSEALADPSAAIGESPDETWTTAPISYPRMLAVLALSFGYVLAMTSLGYLASSVLYVVALLLLFGIRRPLAIAATAFGLPAVLYGLFGWLLGVPLPGGVLEALLGIA
jgi:putative tricarboxylic transport membrane protein